MRHLIILFTIAAFMISGCGKDDDASPAIKKESLSGSVQKGPFISGTSITISELKQNLSQTGKTFTTQIVNNQGSFSLSNVELTSNYVGFRADGFYFNEVTGATSMSQITLYALSDVSDKSTINVNILSHLEKNRIEYLIGQGVDFPQAKVQAQSEILNIFQMTPVEAAPSEILDISQAGENNAILLATSVILQGFRTEGELTELLTTIGTDIREDGVLSNNDVGSQLINHAVYLDTTSIRLNLENRYTELGVVAEIPNFEKYLTLFIENTTYQLTESVVEYPTEGIYGPNILDLNRTNYSGEEFSLSAKLPRGTRLKIKITALSEGEKIWQYGLHSIRDWSISLFDNNTKSQYFTAMESSDFTDLHLFMDSGKFLIEYFEQDRPEPTRTKIVITN